MTNHNIEELDSKNVVEDRNHKETHALTNMMNEVFSDRNSLSGMQKRDSAALPSLMLNLADSINKLDKKDGCMSNLEDRIKNLEDWAKTHVIDLKQNGDTRLSTGDVITSTADSQTMKMKNGDVLKVNKDGSYELTTKDGKVTEHKFEDGTKSMVLKYPNGDTIHFGNDPVTKEGRINAVERGGNFVGIERPTAPTPKK